MKKIFCFFVISFCLFILASCIKNDKKEILDKYKELTKEDYDMEYQYLNDKDNVFKSISYTELFKMIDCKESFILYIGGSWCPNCLAAVPFINKKAKELGISTVYNFDTRIGEKTKENDIRNCLSEASYKLYKDFINKICFINESGVMVADRDVYKLNVPCVISFKDGINQQVLIREYFYSNGILHKKNESIDLSSSYLSELNELMCKIL